MPDREKVIKGLEICTTRPCYCTDCPYKKECCLDSQNVMEDALSLLKEQDARIEKYEHIFHFLGIGFREWTTKINDGEAEVICEVNEHERKTVITFKMI